MIKCADCKQMTDDYRTWNTRGQETSLVCISCHMERTGRTQEKKPRKKKRPGQSSLPKHLQPAFVPMSRSRTGKKRQGFY